ncbi:major facilitator superfamily domain-containing protein [Xylaria intraflava]|nr:major facilitator superfamily domain-containing protein [Xylaria intraflava]
MEAKPQRAKLPAQQLAILAVARFAEPLAMTSVYPYLPEMIASFGVEQRDVAKWAGVTSAVFSLAQSITAVPWGRASDHFGRKPVIITGLFCTMTLFIIWGMSTSLKMAIIVRGFQGACNGNVGIIRTMVAEMVQDRELQPKAFSIMPLVWSIGSVFGPAFGGLFAQPALQFPGMFGDSYFFNKFPFALPNLMAGIVFLCSLTTAILFLKETLQSKRDSRDWGLILGQRIKEAFGDRPAQRQNKLRRYSIPDSEASAPLLQGDGVSKSARATRDAQLEKPARPSMSAVFTRQTVINLVAYTFLALHSVAFDQVLPVFLNYPPQEHTSLNTSLPFFFSGGFGLNSGYIGTIFTLYGIVSGAIQFMLFPTLCARFGVLRCFRVCVMTFPLVYFVVPFTVLVENVYLRYAALITVMVIKAFAVIVGFPCSTILLTNSAASLSILGTLNGFATTFSALGRASGPALAGLAFSWGVKNNMIGAPWWILGVIAIIGSLPVYMIVEDDGPSPDAGKADDTGADDYEDTAVFEDDEPSSSHGRQTPDNQDSLQKDTRSNGYGTLR